MQESLGLLFLILSFNYVQLLILIIKIGVAPLHFWLFSVTNSIFGFNLMWFLTFQKLPFLLIILQLMHYKVLILFLLGLLVCLLQILLIKIYKNLLILSSTESFNWIVLGYLVSFFNVILIFVYYFVLILFLIPKFEYINFYGGLGWETILVFLNIPFRVSFFVKIFSLSEILKIYSFNILILLFLIFLSVLSISFWTVNLRSKIIELFKYNKFVFISIIPLILIILIYFISKIYYIILIR